MTGLLFCKACGSSMHGNTETGGRSRTRRRTYTCPNHTAKRGKSCTTKSINAEYIETAVKNAITDRINSYLQNPDSESIFDSLLSDIDEKTAALFKRISELETKILSFVNAGARATSEVLIKRYEAQAQECISCQEEKRIEIDKLNALSVRIDEIKQQFSENGEKLQNEDIFTENSLTREIVRMFIGRIEVDDESGEITIDLN